MTNIAQTRASSATEGTFNKDQLQAGDFPIRTSKLVLISGQNVARGAVLGKITASGKLNLSLSAAGDGSQVPHCIAAEDVDATSGDKDIVVYLSGDFNQNKLIFGTAHTIASTREGLRDLSIFLHNPVSA